MAVKKNWLIRTHDFNILGPVSKQKILELIKNGSLHPLDELSSGNGYWFFIKERDYVQRFIIGDEFQPFNPIVEAHSTLTAHMDDRAMQPLENQNQNKVQHIAGKEGEEQVCIPSANDLEYPSMPGMDNANNEDEDISDHTLVTSLSDLGASKAKNVADPSKKKI